MKYIQSLFSTFLQIVTIGFLNHFVVLSDALAQTPSAPAVVTADAPTKGLLFEIKSGGNTAYLFGSIHIAKADFYPMSAKVEDAYKQADVVAVEADTSDPMAMQAFMPKLSYVAPDKLQNHLKPETWTLMQSMFGPGADQMQGFKPFVVTSAVLVQVGMQMGFDPNQGIDLHFIKRAKADKKKVVELEGVDFQVNILGNLNDQDGDAMIASMLESMKTGEMMSELNQIVSTWKAADAAGIAKIFTDSAKKNEGSRKLMKMMMDDRNEGMVTKINDLMKSGKKVLVVVGAGHLAGEKSIVDLMQKQGMEVKQIR